MQSLPDFGDRLRARDCELMLQYLTVPYIRIPLVIKFFADPVRMQVSLYGIYYIYDMEAISRAITFAVLLWGSSILTQQILSAVLQTTY